MRTLTKNRLTVLAIRIIIRNTIINIVIRFSHWRVFHVFLLLSGLK